MSETPPHYGNDMHADFLRDVSGEYSTARNRFPA